jgi:uncharacterized membrane protein YccC
VVYAGVAVVALAATAGTSGSLWYVTPTFTVLMLLVHSEPQDTQHRLLERVGDNLLGVLLATVFVGILPRILDARR